MSEAMQALRAGSMTPLHRFYVHESPTRYTAFIVPLKDLGTRKLNNMRTWRDSSDNLVYEDLNDYWVGGTINADDQLATSVGFSFSRFVIIKGGIIFGVWAYPTSYPRHETVPAREQWLSVEYGT